MPQMQIPFIGGAYRGRSPNVNAQRCVNLYPELDQQGGKVVAALYGTPGLSEFCDTGFAKEVRGLKVMGSFLYAQVGNRLYEITSAAVATNKGAMGTKAGPVRMATDGTNLMVTDDDDGYTYTVAGGAVAVIADADFPTPSSLTYQDGYFMVSKADSGRFYLSALKDPTDWDALVYATAEGAPDNLVGIISDHRELWNFGSETIEVYYNSGEAFPFVRVPGVFIEEGLGAAQSLAKIDNSIFWLDQKGMVRRAEGYIPRIVSTRQIEYQIAQYSTFSDAIGFAYAQEGHSFYVLTFPTGGDTWVYDAANTLWHERASYPRAATGIYGRWRGNCYAYFAGKHLVGDHSNGKIYELNMDTYTDNDEVIPRIRAAPVIHKDRREIFFNRLEVEFEAGVGLSGSGQGSDPQAIFDWSNDGGHTWSNEHWRDIGKIGEYSRRAIMRRMGRSRNRVQRVTVTDPVRVVMIGAYLDAELGIS